MKKKADSRLADEAIDAPEWDYLYTETSVIPQAGLGLFTAIDIYAGEHIAEYTGRLLSDVESDRLIAQGKDDYFLMLPDGRILDAGGENKCAAAYANDARGIQRTAQRNNAFFDLTEDKRVVLVASRNIKAGSEILCAYGTRYWKKRGVKTSRKKFSEK